MSGDPRRARLLAELGIDEWQPRAVPASLAAAVPVAAELEVYAPPAPAEPVDVSVAAQADAIEPPLPASDLPADLPPEPPTVAPASASAQRRAAIAVMDWSALEADAAGCTACSLCSTRKNVVFGVGTRPARLLVIGEAPGADEDATGTPFVGQAGKLLDSMLGAIGLDRARDVYIANVLKCRPPRNRDPLPEEVQACSMYLARQAELLAPAAVLLVGRFAAQAMLGSDAPVGQMRGRVHRLDLGGRRVPAVVSYHPAYLLRSPGEKAKAWADLCRAVEALKQVGD
ncbi:uracil-DNA glycosylase [Derxia lacustris]|uniref:uracil-DNA glycosylase n=1 Tax=Derxia lacustris TaxID=764842 RepID=UPI000A1767D4|nr:uracil-DNA glycosylase [Derxia lacustris]